MSIAEKLLTIAENEHKVYEKGYADGVAKGYADGYADGVASMTPKTFTVTYAYIGGGVRTFEFDKGMTWQEWCESKYNTEGYWVDVGVYAPAPSGDESTNAYIYNDYYENYTMAYGNDEIIEGHEYHYIYWE
jgi:hypothetical protein